MTSQLRQGHEKEKKELVEMRSMLKASFNDRDDKDHKEAKEKMKDTTVYNLHQMQVYLFVYLFTLLIFY